MPVSTSSRLSPFSTSKHRIAQEHRLFASAVMCRDHSDFGTTPNMAPPSNMKFPVWMVWSCMVKI